MTLSSEVVSWDYVTMWTGRRAGIAHSILELNPESMLNVGQAFWYSAVCWEVSLVLLKFSSLSHQNWHYIDVNFVTY